MPSVLFHDGLGQYADTTDMATRFLSVSSGTLAADTPRTGAKEYTTTAGTASSFGGFIVAVNPSASSGVVGSRVYVKGLSGSDDRLNTIFEIRHPSGTGHLSLGMRNDGSLRVARSIYSGTTLGTSAAGVLAALTRYFIEMVFTIDETAGSVEVFVNGVSVLSLTGQDTCNVTGETAWTTVAFNAGNATYGVKHTDVYVADDADDDLSPVGECQTDFHQLNGDGNSSDWTRSTGAVQYATIEEVPVSATDYNGTATVGNKDTMALEALKETGAEIIAVTPVLYAWKEEPGSALIKTVVRRGTTDYASTTAVAPSEGSANARHLSDLPLMTDPSTDLPWTETDFNGMEVGYEKVS
jgi:hypothetical protein